MIDAGLNVVEIHELRTLAARGAARPRRATTGGQPVAVVEYRDGTVSDVVAAVV